MLQVPMKIREFLFHKKISQLQAGKQLGLSQGYMNRLVNEKQSPSIELMEKIYVWSKGAVTPNDFIDINKCKTLWQQYPDRDECETFKIDKAWWR
jgi:transcriptional regulator with XRE-family HTH domain